MTRTLVSDDGTTRVYEIRDDKGNVACVSHEPAPGSPAANAAILQDRARQALAANATYLALASPSAALTTVQVQRLTRECSALIRLLLGEFDTVSDS